MARLTVEDCLPHVQNRFDLVLLAAKRARQIAFGSIPLVAEEGDKPTVMALREIAAGLMSHETFDAIEARENAAHEEDAMAAFPGLEPQPEPPAAAPAPAPQDPPPLGGLGTSASYGD